MKKDKNYHLAITYSDGTLTSEFCNNYNCVNAYAETLINEYKKIKVEITDANGRTVKLYNNL